MGKEHVLPRERTVRPRVRTATIKWNRCSSSHRFGKTSFPSGIVPRASPSVSIPLVELVFPSRWDEEHRFHLLRLRYYGSATQKQVTNTEIPCFLTFFYVNNDHFQHNHRNGCKKWHFKNSKSNVKLFGKFSNHDILIFSNHPQYKFVHRHVQL